MNDHDFDVLLTKAAESEEVPSAALNLNVINCAKQSHNQHIIRKQYKNGFLIAFITYLFLACAVSAFLLLAVIGNLYLQLLYIFIVVLMTVAVTAIIIFGLRAVSKEVGVLL